MLLEQECVDPDCADFYNNRTPLSWAAMWGHEGVVKMLLERGDVNPNQTDTDKNWTPLSWAALRGDEGVVKMLLTRKDILIATLDKENQTPLSLALSKGHSGVVKIILDWDALNSDRAGCGGQASLPRSAGNRGEYVADM